MKSKRDTDMGKARKPKDESISCIDSARQVSAKCKMCGVVFYTINQQNSLCVPCRAHMLGINIKALGEEYLEWARNGYVTRKEA